jgi:hypothetical protein
MIAGLEVEDVEIIVTSQTTISNRIKLMKIKTNVKAGLVPAV